MIMKRALTLFIGFVFIVTSGCMIKKQSAVERLLAMDDPVAALRIPDAKVSPAKDTREGLAGKIDDKAKAPAAAMEEELDAKRVIDLNRIKKVPGQAVKKVVTVTSDNVPLRKGPGALHRKVGIAYKGDNFELLRIQTDPNGVHTWYLVQDEQKNKMYLSGLLATIKEVSDERAAPTEKEFVRKVRKLSLESYQTALEPIPPLPPDLKKAKFIDLNFLGTDINEVIATFCELMKIDYVIEGEISGEVTLQTFNKIPVEDLYYVIEEILALHGVAVVKSGHFYRFIPIKDAARKPLNIYFGDDPNIPSEERPIIQVVYLKHVSVEKMKVTVEPLLSRNAQFIKIGDTNTALLIDLASNVKRVVKVMEALDVDKLAFSDAKLYRFNNADAEIAAVELEEIFTSLGYGDALGKTLTFQYLGRLNSILVVNAFDNLQPLIEFWINKLDEPVTQGGISTFVYYVQNVDALELADLLNSIFQKEKATAQKTEKSGRFERKRADSSDKAKLRQASKTITQKVAETTRRELEKVKKEVEGQMSSDEFEGEIEIIPDKTTNALIIRTKPRNYAGIMEIIKKLDLFPQQVLIEVLILDLTIDSDTLAGIEWALQGSGGSSTFTGGVKKVAGSLGSQIGTATATLLSGGSFFVGSPDRLFFLLQAFAADSKVDILSNPILVTLDNQEANISVTQEIPIASSTLQTQTQVSTTSTSIEFRSVGIKLDILPQINSDNYVHLKIDQEISSVGPTFITGTTTTPSFNTRFLSTQVVLKDNQVLVMGGLLENTSKKSNEGLPGLKDIPILGYLFGSNTRDETKTELMLFIIPHVISSPEDSVRVTNEFQNRLGRFSANYPIEP